MQPEQAVHGVARQPTRLPVRRIQADRGLLHVGLAELWRFHELLLFLVWRDIKARYRQTVLGGFWAIFRPFVSMVVFTVIFGHVAKIKTGSDLPYALFVFPGVLIWTYFTSALNGGASAVVGNAQLVTKAYFPRIHLLFAALVAPLIDFLLSLVIVIGLFAYYHRVPTWHILLLPVFVGLTFLLCFGLSLWLAPLTVRYRDVPYALPFAIQIWMYLTPVLYPPTFVPQRFHWLLALNPVSGAAVGTRWSLVGGGAPGAALLGSSVGVSIALIVTGTMYFRRREPSFPDHI